MEILNILDDHSRLAIASTTLAVFTAADVVDAFTDAYCTHGLPQSVLTDFNLGGCRSVTVRPAGARLGATAPVRLRSVTDRSAPRLLAC